MICLRKYKSGVDKDTKVREHFKQATVLCNDLPLLVDLVLKKRSLEDCNSLLIKIGIDAGGDFLTFCMSVFDINNLVSGLSKKFKDSGAKKTFLIVAVSDVPENFVKVKKFWINLELQKLGCKFTIATDLKL